MKNLKSLLLFFFFPLFGFAQSLNGIYTGVLSNDSNTVRRDQSFEMALTEYKGKVYGYAYSTFIVNDTLYYIVKRVKGEVNGDVCEVEDDEVITHNFPQKPEKGVFVSYTLHRNISDSLWTLDGGWKTNVTKKYYALSGKVETKEEKDFSKSRLYEHLGDLKLQETLVFNKPKEPATEKKATKAKDTRPDIAKSKSKPDNIKEKAFGEARLTDKKPEAATAKTEAKIPETKTTPVSNISPVNQSVNKDVAATDKKLAEKKPEPVIAKTETKTPDTKAAPPTTIIPANQSVNKDVAATDKKLAEKKPEPVIAKTETKTPDTKAAPPTTIIPANQSVNKDVAANNTKLTEKKTEPVIAKTETKTSDIKTASTIIPANQKVNKDVAVTNTKLTEKKPETKTAAPVKLADTVNNPQAGEIKKDVAATEKKPDADFEFRELKRANRKLKPAAALVDARVSNPTQTIYFQSDSLILALYDNGEVDGDTVSVIINDEVIIDKQRLKSSAFKQTFYVPKEESDSLLVVLYADNLGAYPPNTGLLIIKDGTEQHYVYFKADLDRNAAIVLRRKFK
jgi:hypothetical protein